MSKLHDKKPVLLRRPILLVIILIPLLSFILLVVSSNYYVTKLLERQNLTKSDEELFKKRFLGDLKYLKKYSHPISRDLNAQSYISKHIDTSDHSKNITDKLRSFQGWRFKSNEMKKLANSKWLTSLDTSWLDRISEYDHWNYLADKKTVELFENAKNKTSMDKIVAVSKYDFPNMLLFSNYVGLYSLKLIKKGESKKAEKFIDKTTDLLMSTYSLIGYVVASQLQKTKNTMIEAFDLNQWQKADEGYILALRRVGWGWSSIMSRNSVNSTIISEFKDYLRPELGVCIGAVEHPLGMSGYQDFLYKRAPFESDHKKDLDHSKEFMLSLLDKCQLDELKLLYPDKPTYPKLFDSEYLKHFVMIGSDSSSLPFNIAAVPYLRRFLFVYLSSVAVPSYSQIYFRNE